MPAGRLVSIPFQLPLPWETPMTTVGGMPLLGMSVGVCTDLLVTGFYQELEFFPPAQFTDRATPF